MVSLQDSEVPVLCKRLRLGDADSSQSFLSSSPKEYLLDCICYSLTRTCHHAGTVSWLGSLLVASAMLGEKMWREHLANQVPGEKEVRGANNGLVLSTFISPSKCLFLSIFTIGTSTCFTYVIVSQPCIPTGLPPLWHDWHLLPSLYLSRVPLLT